ncbi:MAG: hypothetical protein ABIE70_13815 [bacterium]
MRNVIIAVLLACLLPLPAAARQWEPFVWSSGEVGGKTHEKVAVLVPIQIEGVARKLYAQLDTGADVTIFYGYKLRGYGVPFDSTEVSSLSFRWYGSQDESGPVVNPFIFTWSMGGEIDTTSTAPGDNIVGTIGLDQVIDKILVLDFPHQRFAVLDDTAAVAALIPTDVAYIDAEIAYNKFYLRLPFGDDTIPAVRYDCGASIATLILPLDYWEWATGLAIDSPQVAVDSVPSWGKYVTTYTAPSQFSMIFGQVHIERPDMMYIEWPDPSLANEKLLGNAPFYDDYVVVVDCIRSKFGVARSVR